MANPTSQNIYGPAQALLSLYASITISEFHSVLGFLIFNFLINLAEWLDTENISNSIVLIQDIGGLAWLKFAL